MTETNHKLRAAFLAALMFFAVFAGTVALAGSAAATHESDGFAEEREGTHANWTSDSDRWQGQSLFFAPTDQNETYQLREYTPTTAGGEVGDRVRVISFRESDEGNRYAHIDTSDLDGEYVITNGSTNDDVIWTDESGHETGSSIASSPHVTVFEQQVTASWSQSEIGVDGSSELELESGRSAGDYDVEITSDNLTRTQLQNVFSEANSTQTQSGIQVAANENLTADFSNVDVEAGDYTFNVDVTDTTANDSATITLGQAGTPDVSFDQSVWSEHQGDRIIFSMTTENVDEFDVVVGNKDDAGYQANLTVSPNENGQVVIMMNTYEAGQTADTEATYTALEDSSINHSASDETVIDVDRLEAGLYDVIAYDSVGQPDNANEEDIAAIDLQDRSTESISVWTAPDFSGGPDNVETINAAKEDGSLTEAEDVAMNDAIYLQVEASGVYGVLANEADLGEWLENNDELDLTLVQTNPGQNQGPHTVDLNNSTTRSVVDEENDVFYLALDSESLVTDRDRSVVAGDEFDVTFSATENYDYVAAGEEESVNDSLAYVERTGELNVDNDGYVTVEPAEAQEISGTTSVAPGTELRIRARATGESPFLKAQPATVHDHGDGPAFHAEFDFSNIAEGQEFTVSVRNGNFANEPVEAPGRVQAPDPATVSISDQEAEETGDVVTVDSVYVPDGGFVTIHDDSLLDGATFDSVRGTSDYLSEGEHQNVEVQLDDTYDVGDHTVIAMPHMDTNGNQEYDFVSSEGAEDGAYEDENGEAVTDQATFSVVEEPTPTPTDEPSDDGEETPTDTEEPTDTDEPDDQPGFGAVVALVALLGAALLAARRHAF